AKSLESVYREAIATGVTVTDRELRAATPALPREPRDWQVSAYPLKQPDGAVLGVTIAVSDITERKRLIDELQRHEALLGRVIDAMPGLVVYIDRDRRYRFANRAYSEWFQRPGLDFEGQDVSVVLGDSAYEQLRENVDRALAGEPIEFESHVRY